MGIVIPTYGRQPPSRWLGRGHAGKQLNTPEYIKKMNDFAVDVLVTAHFEQNLYAYR